MDKPTVRLSGEDGNVFSIIGRVAKALRQADMREAASEFTDKAMASESYDAVIQLAFRFVNVE